ncbi:MAG: VOC family protein [Clostridiaceae bacterium]
MGVNVYLNFNGKCDEAIEFYSEVFKTEKPRIMRFGDMPSGDFPLDETTKKLVLHSELKINDTKIMFSDAHPEHPVIFGNNISLIINNSDIEEIKSIFNSLKEGGTVIMDLQETFWSKCYGSLTDKFGVGWQLSHESTD